MNHPNIKEVESDSEIKEKHISIFITYLRTEGPRGVSESLEFSRLKTDKDLRVEMPVLWMLVTEKMIFFPEK